MKYIIPIILGLLVILKYVRYIQKKKRKLNLNDITILAFLVYLIIFIKITLFQDTEFTLNLTDTLKQANFIPVVYTLNTIQDNLISILKTIIITIPFGFLLFLLFIDQKNYSKLIKIGFMISFIVELLQLFKINQYLNIDDILLNTLGFIIGGSIYCLMFKVLVLSKKQQLLEKIRNMNLNSMRIFYHSTATLIIGYIVSILVVLHLGTLPLSTLEGKTTVVFDPYQLTVEEDGLAITISGYYKANFSRLKPLFLCKLSLNQEPMYDIYTLNEPYSPQDRKDFSLLIVGWNENAAVMTININNNQYTTDIPKGAFAIPFPEVIDHEFLPYIYANDDSKFSVTFYDEFNNKVTIPFIRSPLK